MAEKWNIADKLGQYLDMDPLPPPPAEAGGEGGAGGLPGMGRFSSASLNSGQQGALTRLITSALKHPEKLDKIVKFLNGEKG